MKERIQLCQDPVVDLAEADLEAAEASEVPADRTGLTVLMAPGGRDVPFSAAGITVPTATEADCWAC